MGHIQKSNRAQVRKPARKSGPKVSKKSQKSSTGKQRRAPVNFTQNDFSYAQPANLYQSVRNTMKTQTTRQEFQELIGNIEYYNEAPSTQPAPVAFKMSPINFRPSSRIRKLASCFQKYRFTKINLVIQASAPSTVAGNVAVGYSENPDFDAGVDSAYQVSTLQGAVSAPLWGRVDCPAHFSDTKKWYNIDSDSKEEMMTTQGVFFIVQGAPAAATTPIVAQVWMFGTIEFAGAAAQRDEANVIRPLFIPPGEISKFTSTRHTGTACDWNSATGGTVVPNVLYAFDPDIETRGGESLSYIWTFTEGSALRYLFGKNADDMKNGQYTSWEEIFGELGDPLKVPFIQCYPVYIGEAPVVTRHVTSFERKIAAALGTSGLENSFKGLNLDNQQLVGRNRNTVSQYRSLI